ncbi:O-methylsterigmatocystin oxidoreductase [Mycena sanguinolenta]|uniref:O-methylsterigmatocystin oxidoreductase n=1 Tax=Mycena sanguinolenta TaxID=230812 RepID=A0A8H6ZF76_9AGAR|nr:O-methylsterigmatocystin oxidoreductase [Mycena sanguinolenta]
MSRILPLSSQHILVSTGVGNKMVAINNSPVEDNRGERRFFDDRTLPQEVFKRMQVSAESFLVTRMDHSTLSLLALAVIVVWISQEYFSAWQRRRRPFPPGPSPYPFVGNFWDIPTKLPWLTYTKWGLQYGSDIVHASALGQHIVVVNSVKTAVEIFEKRAHMYSGRPVLTMVELMGWDFSFALLPDGDKWRDHKKCSTNISAKIPQEFRAHLKTLVAAIIMATVYGYEVQPTNDYFVGLSEEAVKRLSDSFFPGAVVVNTFPILRYLPSWMPGADFQRFATECCQLVKEMREAPFDFVKQNMRDGTDSTSVVARLLESNRYDEDAIQDVAGTAYAGGADTTISSLASFFLAMALHPSIQKKAQTEIDTVIGTHRLPEFEDRPSLPYVEALYREVMRWKPVGPLGVAHASTADDVYNGYFIPKGTTVISNIWAMTRDESIYPEPERFNPDRFFTVDGKLNDDNTVLAFGFGRRICVGRHNADATLWATFVSVLATFNIAKAKDDTGKELEIDPNFYSDSLISNPQPFACSIIPRSETTKSLVRATMETGDF